MRITRLNRTRIALRGANDVRSELWQFSDLEPCRCFLNVSSFESKVLSSAREPGINHCD